MNLPMTRLGGVPEVSYIDVIDMGVPNKERVAIRFSSIVDAGELILTVGMRGPGTESVLPLRDKMLWFGSVIMQPNDWIIAYTGSGKPMTMPPDKDYGTVHIAYWGQPTTLFHDPQFVPTICKLSGVVYPARPMAAPQLQKR